MNNQEDISRQEIEYARQLAAIRRAKRGIGVAKDIGKSRYAQNGGNPNGEEDSPQEETLPEEEQPGAAGELRQAVAEKGKEVAKEAAEKVVKKAAVTGFKAIGHFLMSQLVAPPYITWWIIGILAGIAIIILVVVVIQQGGGIEISEPEEIRDIWYWIRR